jgi:predicted Fe-Mo cluster-binding NifX family protein
MAPATDITGGQRLGIPQHGGRISPVFDVASHLLVIQTAGSRVVDRWVAVLRGHQPLARAGEVSGLGIQVLLCGAISRPLEMALQAASVEVIGFLCGPVEEVLAAYLHDRLAQAGYRMPGCCNRRRWNEGAGWQQRRPRPAGRRRRHGLTGESPGEDREASSGGWRRAGRSARRGR